MTEKPHIFGDETKTGQRSIYTGHRRIYVGAGISDDTNLHWLSAVRDAAGTRGELKAREVLPLLEDRPGLAKTLYSGAKDATVVFTDFESEKLGLLSILPPEWQSHAAIPKMFDQLCEDHPQIKRELMRRKIDTGRFGLLARWIGPRGFSRDDSASVGSSFDDVETMFAAMDIQAQAEFCTRLALMVASYDPQDAAERLRSNPIRYTFLETYNTASLATFLDPNRTFDVGKGNSWKALKRIVDAASAAVRDVHWLQGARHGILAQAKSHDVDALQAADLAAGLASRVFELAPGTVRERVARVAKQFSKVLHNGYRVSP